MNHPYLYPDEAPWTDDYYELRAIRNHNFKPDDQPEITETYLDGFCAHASATEC
jgi:hypothetical protein